MNRNLPQSVPFGYEPPAERLKGTMIVYDSFQQLSNGELSFAVETAEKLRFAKLVLYPLHEETIRRMTKETVLPYHKRLDRLHDWKRSVEAEQGDIGGLSIMVEGFEGKRKKYTPIDSALRHLADTYPSPYFLYLTPEMANLFASYSSFEEWIVKLRLVLAQMPSGLHPKLEQYRHRWDVALDS
ncbi:hypothetical protein [Paenibacillus montanisoli]|uniref:Uncharacterized protein n=1 Tax=Paenibacillus montanisoli TaxID=2081970 RepID=A0A328TVY6_9BACL|nr:hypothetical protein [Paenibacillus montanisoli]RAP74657.1 hypothetical protein DL346_21655 [Paenibacillus montanisoli]